MMFIGWLSRVILLHCFGCATPCVNMITIPYSCLPFVQRGVERERDNEEETVRRFTRDTGVKYARNSVYTGTVM